MLILSAAVTGFLLDLLLGDPAWFPHPVVLMGRCITRMEDGLRKRLPKTSEGELAGGVVLALSLPLLTLTAGGTACYLAYRIHPLAAYSLQSLWCWQSLAVKGLADAGGDVYRVLGQSGGPGQNRLAAARTAVGRMVGRDTDRLTEAGVIRAAVESVAENFTDGVAAPMLYFFAGGAPLALAYKSVNTMDSMVGYRTPRYRFFGKAAARLDDAVNFFPARTAALFWVAAAFLTGQDAGNAVRVWRRDRHKTASPNAGQTEAACAGALGIQLGGPAWYFGKRHDKPFLGDATRPPEAADILRANRTMKTASLLLLLACSGVRLAITGGI